MLLRSQLLIAIAASFFLLPRPCDAQEITDDFATDLGLWTFWTNAAAEAPHTYALVHDATDGAPAPSAWVDGDFDPADAIGGPAGRRFGLERLYTGLDGFHLTFMWRATAATEASCNAHLQIADASTGDLLYEQELISGTDDDTGWQTFPVTDFSWLLPGPGTDIHVRVYLKDSWTTPHLHTLQVDNVVLNPTTALLDPAPPVPTEIDSFSTTTDPWALWLQEPTAANTFALTLGAEGQPPSSAEVTGSYSPMGGTRRAGLERTVPVAFPFVLSWDWRLDFPSGSVPTTTLQLRDPSTGSLLHT